MVSLSAEYKPAGASAESRQAVQAQADSASGEAIGEETQAAAVAQPAMGQPKVLHAERAWGKVSRVLQLPVEVDASQAKARYENGVLSLTLPKQARSSVQQLAIE